MLVTEKMTTDLKAELVAPLRSARAVMLDCADQNRPDAAPLQERVHGQLAQVARIGEADEVDLADGDRAPDGRQIAR